MTGIHRAGVTEAAGGLQRSGLIRQIAPIDRAGLQKVACECDRYDTERLQRLLRVPPKRNDRRREGARGYL